VVSTPQNFRKNQLLAALSNTDLALLQPDLEPVELEVRKVLESPTRYFPFARCLARMAPATRLPAALDPYFLPALFAILEKFLPGLPMSLPERAAFAE
jgi:hypothetical protein